MLESQIIQTVLDGSIIEHWHTWPQFHSDVSTSIKNYEMPFLVLLHDESAYKDLFEADFPSVSKEDGGQVKLQEATVDDVADVFPIIYYAEKLPVYCKDVEELYETTFELFEILAETEEMSYFRSGFIQRLIDYMWDSQLVKFYNIVSGMYLLSYLLILSACVCLRWTDTHPYGSASARATLLGINMLVLILSLCTFEIKSLMADGLDYFSSFWNKNDMMLFALSAANLA